MTALPRSMKRIALAVRTAGRAAVRFIALALGLAAAGCSSFERAWRQAEVTDGGTNTIVGRWSGSWNSEVTHHHDQLRCVITPQTNNILSARFHAKYKKLFRFSFSYTVPLAVQLKEGIFYFEGEADLGWYAGGMYRYQGSASRTNFFSTYQCKYDHGTFQMTRPTGAE